MADSSSLRSKRTRKFKSEINVVPYIDVMLVLLIIFMAAAPAVTTSVINLPTAGKSVAPPPDYIQISLQPNERATIGVTKQQGAPIKTETARNRLDLVERLQALQSTNSNLAVMIFADKDIKYDEVVHIISEAKKLGFQRVGLATN
jgi:biopolymer transport protein TolR